MSYTAHVFSHPDYAPATRIAEALRQRDRIVITAHANPDGDALGSMAALGLGLASIGKTVALCNTSGVPEYLQWMPLPSMVHNKPHKLPFTPELAVVLDCGDAHRLGDISNDILSLPSINIDHHLENPQFGSVDNWTEPRMAATGQMVAAVLHALDVPLQGHLGEALYASISSDTGGFGFDNTTACVFALAAHLVEMGVNVAQVRQLMDNQWELRRMHLWGDLMQSFELAREGSIALSLVPLKTLAKHKAMKEDLEGFVEQLRRLRGVEVSIMLREDHHKRCKLSMRSSGEVDVRAMAAEFGGGGHRNAAGATMNMGLTEAGKSIEKVAKTWLDEHGK